MGGAQADKASAGNGETLRGGAAGDDKASGSGGVADWPSSGGSSGHLSGAGDAGEIGAGAAGRSDCLEGCAPDLAPPSCVGLAATCGPHADESCCSSPLVEGGTFYRSYDGAAYPDMGAPATISDFSLDKYEVTVGRFRRFIAAWVAGWRPAPGSGKHSHLNHGAGLNGSESGWVTSWEHVPTIPTQPLFPSTIADWDDTLGCQLTTWTPEVGANETLPVTCIAFQETYAFWRAWVRSPQAMASMDKPISAATSWSAFWITTRLTGSPASMAPRSITRSP